MGYTKTLKFAYSDLPKAFNLLFTFDDQEVVGGTMYKDFFPVAWRVARLHSGGQFMFSETYDHEFALAASYVDRDVVKGISFVDIKFKEETTLTEEGEILRWSEPQLNPSIADNQFAMKNKTGRPQGISSCIKAGGIPQSLLYLEAENVAYQVRPTPRLRIYLVGDMQEGSIIRTEITTPRLWDHDLLDLGLPNDWIIRYDIATGRIEINPAE